MKSQCIDWVVIDEAAERLGVSEHARKKWRDKTRGVPAKYWLAISRVTMGKITMEALEASKDAK
jgi:DNA-binding transcriptional regulator YdaS (Cro superfamily)